MKKKENLTQSVKEMGYERNSECWYKDVCSCDCTPLCVRFNEMKFLIDNSGIPLIKQKPVELDAGVDYNAFCTLQDWKESVLYHVFRGDNLYICSTNTGNGKTSWAIKILLRYFDEVWAGNGFRVRGMFVHVPTLLLQLKNFESPVSQVYRDNLLKADLVVFDDISEANISKFDYTNLLMIVDSRVLNGKSCIYTSNRTTKTNLEDVIGVRLASRIFSASQVVELHGKDRR